MAHKPVAHKPVPGRPAPRSAASGKAPAKPRRYGRDANPPAPITELWLFGTHAVRAALANPARARLRLVASRNAANELAEAMPDAPQPELATTQEIAALLPPGAVHQGLALLTKPLPDPGLEETCLPPQAGRAVIALDQVTDPHNVGAVLRSCAVFNTRALVTTRRRSPPLTGTLAKTATGAAEHVPYVLVGNLAEALTRLKDEGYKVVGLAEEADGPLHSQDLSGPVILVLGAEGTGLRARTRGLCDALVCLPASGPIRSLNVSNAAALALYETARQSGT